jgi:beta-glucanase (GH16 family)
MKRTVAVTITLLFVLMTASSSPPASPSWVLTWSDEFDGAADLGPDTTKWGFDTGGNGWGNNEQEYYTNRTQNAFTDGTGNLVIKAIKETFTGTDGVRRDYTSARLLTLGKFTQRFGRFEARIKIPVGQGIWPAFWMLGDDIGTANWPTCGEIDIMENRGREPSINYGSLHGPGYSGSNPLSASFTLPGGERFTDDFHLFAIEWEPNAIRFYVDGNLYQTRTPADVPGKVVSNKIGQLRCDLACLRSAPHCQLGPRVLTGSHHRLVATLSASAVLQLPCFGRSPKAMSKPEISSQNERRAATLRGTRR